MNKHLDKAITASIDEMHESLVELCSLIKSFHDEVTKDLISKAVEITGKMIDMSNKLFNMAERHPASKLKVVMEKAQ